jgi:cytoskeletal protein RodZ
MPEIGATLREARMRAKIDVSEVEAATKIRAKYLRALENEEWSLLPGPTFVKSFLRTYADHLGVDSKLILEEYRLRYESPAPGEVPPPIMPAKSAPPRERRQPPRRGGPPRGPLPRGLIVAVSVLGVLAILIVLGVTADDESPTPSPVVTTKPSTTTPATTRARPAPAPTTVRLELAPSGPVWVCLVDADGKQLIDGVVLNPGDRKVQTSKSFKVTFGNGSVAMKVNGRDVSVPKRAVPIGYAIDTNSVKELEEGKQVTCA